MRERGGGEETDREIQGELGERDREGPTVGAEGIEDGSTARDVREKQRETERERERERKIERRREKDRETERES